jgi:hypothetical protein
MKLKLRTDSQHEALANGAIGVGVRVDGPAGWRCGQPSRVSTACASPIVSD